MLILDEPTDGLDPNQRRETLALIARLGKERTVVLSTHILPEVESVCARVVILDRGRVIAEGTPAELVDAERDLRPGRGGDRDAILAAARAVDGVVEVVSARGRHATASRARATCASSWRAPSSPSAALRELRPAALGLERVFEQLTVRASRRGQS